LYSCSQSLQFIPRDLDSGFCLTKQWNNGLSGVSSHDRNNEVSGGVAGSDFCGESRSTHNVKSSNTEKSLWVENFMCFENFCDDGDSRVDGIGNDEDECVGTVCGDTLCQISNNPSVNFEKIYDKYHAQIRREPSRVMPG